MKAAYADPPYLGLAEAFYGKMHPEAAEYDKPETHQRLIEMLCDEYDSWAMSLHEPSLKTILGMCPNDVRVAAWVKPFASMKKGVTRAWTWEPIIFRFGSKKPWAPGERTWRDHVVANMTMLKGFRGAKPDAVSFWIFEGLNLTPEDEFCDLFPGSGSVGRAWEKWKAAHQRPEQFTLEAV